MKCTKFLKPLPLVLIILVLSNFNQVDTFAITAGTILTVAALGRMVVENVLTAWEFVDASTPKMETDMPFMKYKQKKIFAKLNDLSTQIHLIEHRMTNVARFTIEKIEDFVKSNTKLELQIHELTDMMNRLTVHDNVMREYSSNLKTLEQNTIVNFAEFIVSPNSIGVQALLDRIHLLMTGTADLRSIGQSGLFNLIGKNMQETKTYVCNTKQSPQQLLLQLYNAISVAELKGYAMMQFSWMILKTYEKGNYTREAELMRKRFEERTNKTQTYLRKIMEIADRSVWRCDPSHHVEGETYVALTRLLQGYIENEVDLNGDNTCKENCGHYQFAENQGCYKDLYCSKQPKCHGKLLDCKFVDSDMWICQANKNTSRRYEYIEYENGKILGDKASCQRGTEKVDSWWRWIFWHCSYCFCLCDEQGPKSDRYFSLREATTNTTAGMVVTGVRFVKVKRVVSIQIQEGILLNDGVINAGSLRWKPVNEFDIRGRGIKNGQDYHTMGWDKRSIDLDDLTGPASHVVTGVRFRLIGPHLNLEIRLTEFDFTTGKLIDPEVKSYWHSNDNTDASTNRRTAVKLTNPNVPTKTISKSEPDSKTNQYIDFTNSDMDSDGAQTTVPFLDAQDVISEPPVPLSGIGIYHKGRRDYGGFVAPKIYTYDFSPHIQNREPEDF